MKTLLAVAVLTTLGFAQHDISHHDHCTDVKQHGAEAMGFDQDKTTHHFVLTNDGGYVQVTANDAKDDASIAHIRHHLQAQEKKFAAGDFAAPEHTHSQVPPGVPTMQKLKTSIHYRYQSIERGARLHFSSKDAKALAAIHDFLRFQISDHQTGDSTAIQAPK